MKPEMAQKLAAGYVLLRRIEHRIQYLDDQQTHLLPTADEDLAWIARSLGLVCKPEACELLDRLCEVRELVAAEFDALLRDGQGSVARRRQRQLPPLRHGAAAHRQRGPARQDAARTGRATAALGAASRACWRCATRAGMRLGRLMQKTAQAVQEGDCTDHRGAALRRLGRAAAATRELSRAAARTPRGAPAPAARAGHRRAGPCST